MGGYGLWKNVTGRGQMLPTVMLALRPTVLRRPPKAIAKL